MNDNMNDNMSDNNLALQETHWVYVPEARVNAVLSQKEGADKIINDNGNIRNNILNKLKTIHQQIIGYLDDNHIGEKIENGFKIAIVGEPNVGKSSLINYLAKKPIAIVSEIAGTTRDLVTVNLNIDGYQVTLIDTAGIRETEDIVESIGVKLAKNVIKEADLILVMSTLENLNNYKNYISEIDERKHIFVLNKMDEEVLQKKPGMASVPDARANAMLSLDNGIFHFDGREYVAISIQNENNLDILIQRIRKSLLNLFPSSSPIITTKRQRILLEQLGDGLMKIIDNFWQYPFLDIMTEDIRNLATYVSQLTGNISTDDVLDELFINFCIGK
jgi:tRNA modification GTPase